MAATWPLSAAPLPQTACFTSFGVGSSTSRPASRGGEQRDAASLADGHGGLHVALEEEPLDADAVRLVHGQELDERGVQAAQAVGIGPVGLGPDHARIDHAQAAVVQRHHPESAAGGAWVDAERDHPLRIVASSCSIKASGRSKLA